MIEQALMENTRSDFANLDWPSNKSISRLLAMADIKINGDRPWDIQINHPDFFSRVLFKRSLGLGESYMDGWWDSDSLELFFYQLFQSKLDTLALSNVNLVMQFIINFIKNPQSVQRAKEVAIKHYDLDNDLFEFMLDETMNYSCAYWHNQATLKSAQEAKLDLVCKKLQLEPGMTMLDIGCGWGGLAAHAATHYGVLVDGITISEKQRDYAVARCKDLPVKIMLQDYRLLENKYDRIASIGMFEHVGAKNYHFFMSVLNRLLENDGLVLLHTIGNNITTKTYDPWINKYIFPNGEIPSLKQISEVLEDFFIIEDCHNFGPDYDKTLKAWQTNFNQNWQFLSDRYDMRFYRMWNYYLSLCAALFKTRTLQLWQLVLSKPGFREETYMAPR